MVGDLLVYITFGGLNMLIWISKSNYVPCYTHSATLSHCLFVLEASYAWVSSSSFSNKWTRLMCDDIAHLYLGARGERIVLGRIHAWPLVHVKWGSSDSLVSHNVLSGTVLPSTPLPM